MELVKKKKIGLWLPPEVETELNRLVDSAARSRYRVKGSVLTAAVLSLIDRSPEERAELIDQVLNADIRSDYTGLVGRALNGQLMGEPDPARAILERMAAVDPDKINTMSEWNSHQQDVEELKAINEERRARGIQPVKADPSMGEERQAPPTARRSGKVSTRKKPA